MTTTSLMSFWSGLSRAQQAVLVALALVLPAALFFGSQWIEDGQYVPLFASMNAEDAGTILNQLKAAKTPYRIGGTGEQILVPADKVAELRLRMAVQGLPLGGGVGFEVFDKPAFGASDFTQRLNYQRALQGELQRTIGQLREVARARVHLVLPQPSVFAERERPASASVFLKLAPGAALGREEVRGIVHLVASSVEGLTADRITIIDTAGHVLSVGGESGAGSLSPRRLEAKSAAEEGLERRVQSLLDSTLGPGQSVARVSMQMSFDQVERTEEKFDPTAVVRQKTRSTDSTRGSTSTPGLGVAATPDPGTALAAATPPNAAASATVTTNQGTRESESTSYEISRTVARTVTGAGEIQRLSVAVILNTPTRVTRPATKDKAEVREAVPRPAEEIEKIRKVVMGAAGASEARKDEVTVVEMPFDTTVLERERVLLDQPAPPATAVRGGPVNSVTLGIAGGVVALAVVGWFLTRQRPAPARSASAVVRAVEVAAGSTQEPLGVPAAPSVSLPAAPLVPEELMQLSRQREDLRQKAVTMAATEPDATAQLLRAWLVKKKPHTTVKGVVDVG